MGLFVWISGEFARVRNWPILSRKPGRQPMVLNMTDFGMCRKSLQTPWNASYMLVSGFLTAYEILRVAAKAFSKPARNVVCGLLYIPPYLTISLPLPHPSTHVCRKEASAADRPGPVSIQTEFLSTNLNPAHNTFTPKLEKYILPTTYWGMYKWCTENW